MPSPFPGMDPYLEDPSGWPGVHSRLINSISDILAPQLAPDYIVQIEERVYVASPEELSRRVIVPDLYLVEHGNTRATGAATTISPATLIEPLYDEEVRDRFIEIRTARNNEVVTTIEVLSPANKHPESTGRRQFLRKREAILSSLTHWIEIDLLRAGDRPGEVAGRGDYYALLIRANTFGPYEGWFADLRDPLPTIAVPLRQPDADVPLNLQAAINLVYERGYYAASIDYTRLVPLPPLSLPDANWAAARVREWQQARASATSS
jgi:hypothetical protein